MMHYKKITIFELANGENKGLDGCKKETPLLLQSLRSKGFEAEVVFFSMAQKEEIFEAVSQSSVAYFSRVEMQNLSKVSQESYLELLKGLCNKGLVGFPMVDELVQFETKDALLKLVSSGLIAEDSYGYGSKERFKDSFPYSLAKGDRVLKPSLGRGGIWKVSADLTVENQKKIEPDEKIRILSATSNQTREVKLSDFLEGYAVHIDEGGAILDVPFLPFVKEGEITLYMLYDTPYEVLRKIPSSTYSTSEVFGTSLFLGTEYRYESLEKYSSLISWFKSKIPELSVKLTYNGIPLLWSADFIPCQKGYVLNQLNIASVNFANRLDIVDTLTDAMIRFIRNHKKIQE